MSESKTLFNSSNSDLNRSKNEQTISGANDYNQAKMEAIYKKILYIFENKKIYLDAHLNLTQLSLVLCTNTTYLSKVINQKFGCNLKTVLNRYRIEYAKQLLIKEDCNVKSLPSRCGFISRSTFYASFTKFEKITPNEFRAQYQSFELLKEIETNINKLSINQ